MVNILLVENDESHRCLIKAHLRRPDLQILEASTDSEGRNLLKDLRPDLVLMDIMMPRGYNWHLLEELKQGPDTKDIPVIVVTVADEKNRAIAMGADSYIRKPFSGNVLKQEVDRFLSPNPISHHSSICQEMSW